MSSGAKIRGCAGRAKGSHQRVLLGPRKLEFSHQNAGFDSVRRLACRYQALPNLGVYMRAPTDKDISVSILQEFQNSFDFSCENWLVGSRHIQFRFRGCHFDSSALRFHLGEALSRPKAQEDKGAIHGPHSTVYPSTTSSAPGAGVAGGKP